jgi:hypothetical protein
VVGELWLADTFGFNGHYAKQIRQEANREFYLYSQQVDSITRAVSGK